MSGIGRKIVVNGVTYYWKVGRSDVKIRTEGKPNQIVKHYEILDQEPQVHENIEDNGGCVGSTRAMWPAG